MKKFLLITGGMVLCLPLYADLSVAQIQKMIVKIHQKRTGTDIATINQITEPFVFPKKDNNATVYVVPTVTNTEVKLSLHAIMNGKAYINDKWEKTGSTVLGYTLRYVGKRGVVLQNGNQIKKLFLHEKKNNFIQLEEGE